MIFITVDGVIGFASALHIVVFAWERERLRASVGFYCCRLIRLVAALYRLVVFLAFVLCRGLEILDVG